MHFTGTKYLHEIESLMQGVPGFSVKGHGGIILKKRDGGLHPGAATTR